MNKNSFRPIMVASLTVLSLFVLISRPTQASLTDDKKKITAEEVVSKHLESIGTAKDRNAVTTRVISGTCKFSAVLSTGGNSATTGEAVMASTGAQSVVAAVFPETGYPFEKYAYDGKKITTGFIKPGLRSTLGNILLTFAVTLKEGLLGGSLSSAWPMWNMSIRNANLEYGGTKKIKGREAHLIKYNPRKGGEMAIKLYFDAETFQHVRSEYTKTIASQMGATPEQSSNQVESRYQITEDFSVFAVEGGLTLPHMYVIEIVIDNQSGTSRQSWAYNFSQFAFNHNLDDIFDLEGTKTVGRFGGESLRSGL